MTYFYIFATILFTVYGQIMIKIRIPQYGALPSEFGEKVVFLLRLFLDPLIFSAFISAFVASLFWMAAMTKTSLSFAYPFMGLNFVLVLILSVIILKEPFSVYRLIGVCVIMLGIFIASRSL